MTPLLCSSAARADASPKGTFSLNNPNVQIAFMNSFCLVTKQFLFHDLSFSGEFFIFIIWVNSILFSCYILWLQICWMRPYTDIWELPVKHLWYTHLSQWEQKKPELPNSISKTQKTPRPSSAWQLRQLLHLQLSVLMEDHDHFLLSGQQFSPRTVLWTFIYLSFTP